MLLVNARHVKTLPGRKTDVADATWLAQLGAHGLVRGSFVPPEPIRQLRDLTRARTAITRERGREVQRLEKLLEDAGIKLSSVSSDIMGVSGRLMLQALIAGDRDPAVMAEGQTSASCSSTISTTVLRRARSSCRASRGSSARRAVSSSRQEATSRPLAGAELQRCGSSQGEDPVEV